MEAAFHETVTVGDVVADGILHAENGAFDVWLMRVKISVMHGCQVTSAEEIDFALIEGLLADPFKGVEAVRPFIDVSDAIAFAAAATATMLGDYGLAMSILLLEVFHIDIFTYIWRAAEDNGKGTCFGR